MLRCLQAAHIPSSNLGITLTVKLCSDWIHFTMQGRLPSKKSRPVPAWTLRSNLLLIRGDRLAFRLYFIPGL
jgi:hypothetical protein